MYSILSVDKKEITSRSTYGEAMKKYRAYRNAGEIVFLVYWVTNDAYEIVAP